MTQKIDWLICGVMVVAAGMAVLALIGLIDVGNAIWLMAKN